MRHVLSMLALLLPATPAAAEPLRVAYELSWNAIEVATVETELSRDEAGYRLVWRGQTSGFLGLLYPFASEAWSEGSQAGAGVTPRRFAGLSKRGEDENAWAVDFDPTGRAVRVEIPEDDRADREPVPAELQVGPDPLSLALTALSRAKPGFREAGTAFDGRRVLRIAAVCADAPEATPDFGEALLCTVEGKLVAGASRRWRDRQQPQAERPPTRVWLTRGTVAGGWWPVRIESPTRWGTVTALLLPTLPG